MKYLNLINAVALLHQHQRETKTVNHNGAQLHYIEVQLADIEAANGLAAAVMGTSLDDLPPQTRKLLLGIHTLARERCASEDIELRDLRLTRRQIREATGWSNTQLGIHLERLVDHEYLAVYRGRGRPLVYELIYDGEGQDGSRFLLNLVELDQLKHHYDNRNTGCEPQITGQIRPISGPNPEPPNLANSATPGEKATPSQPANNRSAENHVAGPETTARRSTERKAS